MRSKGIHDHGRKRGLDFLENLLSVTQVILENAAHIAYVQDKPRQGSQFTLVFGLRDLWDNTPCLPKSVKFDTEM